MKSESKRQIVTFALLMAAVVFGMVLAGGLDLTPASMSSPASPAQPALAAGTSTPSPLPSFADLAERVSPAVVSIESVRIQKARPNPFGFGQGQGMSPFEFFFGPQDREPDQQGPQQGPGTPQRFRQEAGGSGFVISPDGQIVTNYHVVEDSSQVKVHLGQRTYEAEIKGTDPATDLALLKIEPNAPLPTVSLGDSKALRVGEWVMAVGNPLQLENTVTVGVVSAKGRRIFITPDTALENFIQTDAAINFGNSGGPLVNVAGQVIGINTAINYGSENIGFAIPVDTLKEILPQLREKGKVSRGFLGIRIGDIDFDDMKAFGLDSTQGALVAKVDAGTPSDKAGLKHGDVIVQVDGRKVEDAQDLINYVSGKPPGTAVDLTIIRNGKTIDRKVTLGERPGVGEQQTGTGSAGASGIAWLGLQYQDLTAQARQSHGIPADVNGIWITEVAPDSPLVDEGVRPGDVITEVGGEPVTSVAEFEKAVGAAGSGSYLRFYVQRFDPRSNQSASYFAVVRVP